MSNSGKKSPLILNAESQLNVNKGLCISPVAIYYQGKWTPEGSTTGAVTETTVLKYIARALPKLYFGAKRKLLSVYVFRNAITIGQPLNRPSDLRINTPSLGDARANTYHANFPGFGSFERGRTVDEFYNRKEVPGFGLNLTQLDPWPDGYPNSPEYSYVWQNWGSRIPNKGHSLNIPYADFSTYLRKYQYYHEYAWLTGWPARNIWQESKLPDNIPPDFPFPIPSPFPSQLRHNLERENDQYSAAYFPRPDMTPTEPWRSRDKLLMEYDEYFKDGFIGLIARLAYYEFWSDYKTRRPNQYIEFCNSWQIHDEFRQRMNKNIASFTNTKKFIKGNFSNINDVTTSDIAGVSLSFKLFGTDMAKLGKSLDLSNMHKFGLPSVFVNNLQKHNALTDAMRVALLFVELTTIELDNIFTNGYIPTVEQEKKIYSALELIKGQDLTDIKIILNCTTSGLDNLTDLMNPRKMFPSCYKTLTVPKYNSTTLSAKNYDFIYLGSGVNNRIDNWGDYLTGIIPDDLAKACGAFMMTMCQIKNIQQMNSEFLAQIIANLEVTNKDLPLVNSTDATPGIVRLANQELASIALGSGSNGMYRFCDFFGAMSAWPYRDFYEEAIGLLKQVGTKQLDNVYKKIYQKSLFNNWALLGRGKGWQDPIINTIDVPPEYQYDIITPNASFPIGSRTLTSDYIIDQTYNLYKPGIFLAFTSEPGDPGPDNTLTYEVTSANRGTVNFRSTFVPGPGKPAPPGWPGLMQPIDNKTELYIWEPTYDGYPGDGLTDGFVQNLIDAANIEILRIQNTNTEKVKDLEKCWDKIGNHLFIETRAIIMSIPRPVIVYENPNRSIIDSFVRNIEEYAQDTRYGETAPVLEAISDLNDVGGQSIVAAMREARNARRLVKTSGEVDNDVPDIINTCNASAVVGDVSAFGGILNVTVTSGGCGYEPGSPPMIQVGPMGGVFGGTGTGAVLEAIVDPSGTISEIIVIDPGSGYTPGQETPIYIEPPPSPDPIIIDEPGTITEPPEDLTVPGGPGNQPENPPNLNDERPDDLEDELITDEDASYTEQEAIDMVTECNCDCWNEN